MISQQPIDIWYGHIVASSLNNPLHWGKERSIRAHQGKIQVANVHLFRSVSPVVCTAEHFKKDKAIQCSWLNY